MPAAPIYEKLDDWTMGAITPSIKSFTLTALAQDKAVALASKAEYLEKAAEQQAIADNCDTMTAMAISL